MQPAEEIEARQRKVYDVNTVLKNPEHQLSAIEFYGKIVMYIRFR